MTTSIKGREGAEERVYFFLDSRLDFCFLRRIKEFKWIFLSFLKKKAGVHCM